MKHKGLLAGLIPKTGERGDGFTWGPWVELRCPAKSCGLTWHWRAIYDDSTKADMNHPEECLCGASLKKVASKRRTKQP